MSRSTGPGQSAAPTVLCGAGLNVQGGERDWLVLSRRCVSGVERPQAAAEEFSFALSAEIPVGPVNMCPHTVSVAAVEPRAKHRTRHPPSHLTSSQELPSDSDNTFQITGLSSLFPFPHH